MKINTISITGKIDEFEIPEKIFSSGINSKLIAHVLYTQIANLKPRVAKTKQRNEIIGYFTTISFWFFANPSACAFTKYIPLAASDASQVRLYIPASLYPLVRIATD